MSIDRLKMPAGLKLPVISVFSAVLVLAAVVAWHANWAEGNTGSHIRKNYSVSGAVADISASAQSVSLSGAVASDGKPSQPSFDLRSADRIESGDYQALALADILPGDDVILQGLDIGGEVTIRRLIDLSWTQSRSAATSTATSTDEEASSTDGISDSTASSTASAADDAAFSADPISTTTDPAASSTDATSTLPESSSTPPADSEASLTDPAPAPSSDADASATSQ